ncbi:centrosome-associated zinc finger protein CP190 [Frankliniella occidentalis]|uniref:Centrosome-associated zinc finger protein CP190 n=1 Tax=Frankliniella occidentalis TaxID=133901 RepID=A0A6J1S208_FRAOC|nr:centrosome-associated zinc finger protein CP190 [Frankliniella occidentalis]
MDGVRMVKVDNWAAFFLQKLQALYTRGDFTDLTLQFHTNECIKVHRLVLNTCTEYFETLIKENNASNHMRLPPTFQSDVVVPIINFMYSGRLEFRPELHQRLYNTAKILNMQILTKLLDTHVGAATTPKPQIQKLKHLTVPINSPSPVSGSPTINSRFSRPDHEAADFVPGKKLPIWKKRTVPSSSFSLNVSTPRAQPEEPAKPTRFEWPEDGDADSTPILYSSTFDDISYDSVPIVKSINSIVQSALPPSPSQPLVQLPQQRVMPAATFESVFQSSSLKRNPSTRPQANQIESCTPKKMKVEIDEVKEHVQAQEVRKTLLSDDTEQENEDLDDFLPVADNDADYEEEGEDMTNETGDLLNSQSLPSTPSNKQNNPKPILKVQAHDSPDSKETTPKKNVRFHLEPKVHAVASTSVPLEPQASSGDATSEGQSVSESLIDNPSSESECSEPVPDLAAVSTKQDVGGNAFEIRAPLKKMGDGSPVQTNHAKIIAEVLKKYPDLVKNNKNIRLKIIQKDGSPAVSVEKSGGQGDSKPKVSYMVVKADQSLRNKAQAEEPLTPEGVLNREGPWLCSTCDVERPIIFDTYFNYRKHLKDVHKAKIDVRICEHCGHRANKRNLLLYHLYKVHGVPPPPSCKFPKCDQCDHIALSEVLLAKHKNIHMNNKDYQCSMCHASFKSHSTLQSHLENSQRCNPRKKSFKCPVCTKVFPLQLNVKNHIRTDHPNLKLLEDMDLVPARTIETHVSQLPEENIGQEHQTLPQVQVHHQQHSIEQTQQQQVPHQHAHSQQEELNQHLQAQPSIQSEVHQQASMNAQPQTTYILPPGVTILTDNNQALMPSTEAEALSNVASGIAASLGVGDSMVVSDQGQPQTFIVVDKNQLIQIPGPGGAPGQVHEYIVPEIMTNDMSQGVCAYAPGHLSQLVQYTTAGGLQQPVAVSTSEQGLMTITTVNANGSIVNHTVPQQPGNPLMETAMMQIPQGHIQDHSGGEITMILTDHAYSEGIVRENGTVMQATSVPVSMNMVPTSAVVSVVSAVPTMPTTVHTSTMGESGMVITPVCSSVQSIPTMVPSSSMAESASVITSMPVSKVECSADENSTSMALESDQQDTGPPTQKMAELASDWDDVEESEDHGGLQRSAEDIAEDAALPSRPSILLKSELDAEDLPDNLPIKMT